MSLVFREINFNQGHEIHKRAVKTGMSISKFTVHVLAHKSGLLHTVDAEFSEEALHMVHCIYVIHTQCSILYKHYTVDRTTEGAT